MFAGASLVAVCLNANGAAGLLQPFRVAHLETLRLIEEWQPSTLSGTPLFYLVPVRRARRPPVAGDAGAVGRLALLLAMLVLAFSQVRHQSGSRSSLRCSCRRCWLRARSQWAARRRSLAALPLLVGRALLPFDSARECGQPAAFARRHPAGAQGPAGVQRLYARRALILAGVRPYIDGRSEMYGDTFVRDYVAIADGDFARSTAPSSVQIRWTISATATTD